MERTSSEGCRSQHNNPHLRRSRSSDFPARFAPSWGRGRSVRQQKAAQRAIRKPQANGHSVFHRKPARGSGGKGLNGHNFTAQHPSIVDLVIMLIKIGPAPAALRQGASEKYALSGLKKWRRQDRHQAPQLTRSDNLACLFHDGDISTMVSDQHPCARLHNCVH